MKKILSIAFAAVVVLALQAQTKQTMDYEQEWNKVAELEKKSLPKSAGEAVDSILQKAIADQNSPQVVKAIIHQGKYDLLTDHANDTLIFHHLHAMLLKSREVVEQSVLHSILGELYLQYYQKDTWEIDQRTELAGFVPEDMKEWTKNIFLDKATQHLNASVASRQELEQEQVESYAAVVELGKDSRRFFPSMYDFLSQRAIEFFRQMDEEADWSRSLMKKNITQQSLFAPTDEFILLDFHIQPGDYNVQPLEMYRQLFVSLHERGMAELTLLLHLDMLSYLAGLGDAYGSYAPGLLQGLQADFKEKPMSVEIVDRMADLRRIELAAIPQEDTLQRNEKARELYDLLQNTIDAFPGYERIGILENRLLQLTQPSLRISGMNGYASASEKEISIEYKNLKSITAKVYRLDSPLVSTYSNNRSSQSADEKKTLVSELQIPLASYPPYQPAQAVFAPDLSHYGAYLLEFETDPPMSRENIHSRYFFSVSDLAVFARVTDRNRYEFFVVDRTSGLPVKNARIDIYKLPGNWRTSSLTLEKSIPVDESGLALYNKDIPNNDVFYQAVAGEDSGSELNRLPWGNYQLSGSGQPDRETSEIFIDRNLYRPGQTVHFKSIVMALRENKPQAVSGKSVEFILRDANGQEVSRQTLTTNEFGSAAGEFVLPQGLLTGYFTITSGSEGAVEFRVEEYKRPTFEVTFDKIDKTYKFGEEITLTGKVESFSGIKLQNTPVGYRIMRRQPWWSRWGGTSEHFAEGTATTGEDGRFELVFTPLKEDRSAAFRSVYSFEVEATVTDVNGETQVGTYSVAVGDISMLLEVEMPDKLEKASAEKVVITAKNLDGAAIKAAGTYKVYSLNENDSIYRQEIEGTFETGEQQQLKAKLAPLPSGKYRVRLASQDDRGNDITAEKDFILFAFDDKQPPFKTNDWFVVKQNTFGPGKDAEVLVGADGKLNILYELRHAGSLVERKWMEVNRENRLIRIPYDENYDSPLSLQMIYVKESRLYIHSADLTPEKAKTGLEVKLSVFRDKIRPGTDEEWRLEVKDADGNPAIAEVLASMYDFSLDRIYQSSDWTLQLPRSGRYPAELPIHIDRSFYPQLVFGYYAMKTKNVRPFVFDRFNWFGFSLYHYGPMMLRSTAVVQERGISFSDQNLMEQEAKMGAAPTGFLEESIVVQDLAGEYSAARQPGQDTPQIRRNFNETAFFYPQLRTNAQGETLIAFTVPESNTRWRFRVLAHDKNLNRGVAEAFAVSRKELMVTPNMPRFLRHGDRTTISTKISNLSDGAISGEVRLELFDPVTDELLSSIPVENQSQPFSLAKDASADASWTFDVPTAIDVIGVRIVAQSEAFSDGEQHALALLPNRMLVTESMRMDVNGTQTKEFTMEGLTGDASATREDYRLTLEFTSNPAWYAVQALPVVGTPDSDNAVSWFAAYYANTLGAHIGKAYPKVTAVIDAWQKQGGSSQTLLSNLEKNEELKHVLLEETPWVLEANDETEQKQQLSLLFDLNRNRNLTRQAMDKLDELQTTSGGWSWFKGFYPSRSVTQYILYGFSRLESLQAVEYTGEIRGIQQQAVAYIDDEALTRFEQLKRNRADWRNIKSLPVTELEYLYIRDGYKAYPLSKELKEMADFYVSVIEQNWTQFGLYERSLIAVLMGRNGKEHIAADILESYREHAAHSQEMGMYWPNNRSQVFMSQSAVSEHTFIMDAFRENDATPQEMDEMKRWLLKQKQTQQWESTHATLDAVYALLSDGTDWFASENRTSVTIAGQTIEPRNEETATGYFKESWHRTEITQQMGRVKIDNQGNSPAWGALYWQYYEELDQITKTDASLDVEKLLFVERTDASGTKLVPVTETGPIRVGDKVVVRLTVRADRDLDFVHLKDMRAAAFEPVEQLSGMKWQGSAYYYQTSKDASTNFYFDHLPRGTYLFEYAVFATRTGSYSNGITTIQCLYAPEFTSHTAGIRVEVVEE